MKSLTTRLALAQCKPSTLHIDQLQIEITIETSFAASLLYLAVLRHVPLLGERENLKFKKGLEKKLHIFDDSMSLGN